MDVLQFRRLPTRLVRVSVFGISLAASGLLSQAVFGEDPDAGFNTRLYLANVDGTNPKPLTDTKEFVNQGSPCWSRDGKLIAFDGCRKGQADSESSIIVVNADGSSLRVLTDGAMPSFSPKGRRIAFSRYSLGRGVWIMSSDGPDEELVQIDEYGWGTDWSPDGTRIAYTKYQPEGMTIEIFSLVEGTRESLFATGESPYRQIFWNFAWSPDGRTIAFKALRKDGKPELAIVSTDGASQGLKTVVEGDTMPAVSYFPDGRLIFSKVAPDHDNHLRLFTIDPGKADPPQLLPHLPPEFRYQEACSSPNGDFLVYCRRAARRVTKPMP